MPTDEPLRHLAEQPKSVESDGQRVENHSLKDQIELDRYLSSKKAAQNKRAHGFRITKLSAGGGPC